MSRPSLQLHTDRTDWFDKADGSNFPYDVITALSPFIATAHGMGLKEFDNNETAREMSSDDAYIFWQCGHGLFGKLRGMSQNPWAYGKSYNTIVV